MVSFLATRWAPYLAGYRGMGEVRWNVSRQFATLKSRQEIAWRISTRFFRTLRNSVLFLLVFADTTQSDLYHNMHDI